ncbi:MAG TPA: flavin reductase, partial [Flavobacteriaceae bacterium]|nr:flavin reductase [Flavobacteriaceae bacterium]
LTGNDLGMLGNVEELPTNKQIKEYIENASETEQYLIASGSSEEIHIRAQELLCEAQIDAAWNLLLARSVSEKK